MTRRLPDHDDSELLDERGARALRARCASQMGALASCPELVVPVAFFKIPRARQPGRPAEGHTRRVSSAPTEPTALQPPIRSTPCASSPAAEAS